MRVSKKNIFYIPFPDINALGIYLLNNCNGRYRYLLIEINQDFEVHNLTFHISYFQL